MKQNLFIVGLGLALAGCGQGQNVAKTTSDNGQPSTQALCQFEHHPCQQEDIGFTIAPAHAPSEQPLTFSLSLPDGYKINKASVAGRDMYMGVIPVNFNPQAQAEVIYGSCATDYMVWRLSIELESESGQIETRYFDWLADAKPSA